MLLIYYVRFRTPYVIFVEDHKSSANPFSKLSTFSKHLFSYRVWYLNFSEGFKKNVNIIGKKGDKILK